MHSLSLVLCVVSFFLCLGCSGVLTQGTRKPLQFPDEFSFRHTDYPQALSTEFVILADGTMQISEDQWRGPAIVTKRVITLEQWRAVFRSMERLKVWDWNDNYYPPPQAGISDGYSWEMRLRMDGRSIASHGSNYGPHPRNPDKAVLGPEARTGDQILQTALERLWGAAESGGVE